MKNEIVFGATSGMVKELAKLLAKDGYNVGTTGRRSELLEKIQQENQDTHFPMLFMKKCNRRKSK